MIWARIFGAAANFDAFIIAFHLPSFIGYVISEAGLTQSFIPVLAEKHVKTNTQQARRFISHAAALLLTALIFIVIFSIIFAPGLITLFAPGFAKYGERQQLAIFLFRVMATGILFTTLASFCSAVLNTFGSYGIPSSMPIIFNGIIIFASIYLTAFFNIPIYAVAWGILISGVMQLLLQLPFLSEKNLLIMPHVSLKDSDTRKMIRLMLPALLGVSVMQTGVFVDFIFSSYLPKGSVTWLYYSSRLMELPVNVIGMGIAMVVLPNLSRSFAKNDMKNYNKSLDWAIYFSLFVCIPASAALFVLSGPIVATLFGHGLFNHHDVVMTQRSTQAFSIGIVGFMLSRVCGSGFYAQQNTKLPVKIAVITLILNIALNFLFIARLAHAGLALATSLSSLINAAILFSILVYRKCYQPNSNLLMRLFKVVLSTFIMITVLNLIMPSFQEWLNEGLKWQVEEVSFEILSGISVYFVSLHLFGFRFQQIRG